MRCAKLTVTLTTIVCATALTGCDTHTQTDALIGGTGGAAAGLAIAGPTGAIIGGAGGAITGALIGSEQDKKANADDN
jgi:hypothetical protein